MKFLLIVLIIRLVISAITVRKNTGSENTKGWVNRNVLHPAEFELRDDFYRIEAWCWQ